jgi:hypothetical protein
MSIIDVLPVWFLAFSLPTQPLADTEPALPVWSFMAAPGAPIVTGDIILCRCEPTDLDGPWFAAAVLTVETDGSVLIEKPTGQGTAKMVRLAANRVLDVARPLQP